MGLEAGEGGPAEAGVLQTLDVPLDMGVSPHGGIRFDGRSFRIGVEAPVAEVETREEAALGAGVEGLPSDDQVCSLREIGILDQRGQLADRSAIPGFAVLGDGWLPGRFTHPCPGRTAALSGLFAIGPPIPSLCG